VARTFAKIITYSIKTRSPMLSASFSPH